MTAVRAELAQARNELQDDLHRIRAEPATLAERARAAEQRAAEQTARADRAAQRAAADREQHSARVRLLQNELPQARAARRGPRTGKDQDQAT